ncbi:hypothetical protein A3A66_01685 [Microgenomates group bacterium RIFCSPLOWO2_01_FULL_46_13]|nr:MAG: hypothetical protein A2783_00720 [Microgenomates group bacterium RIFCSPHIGHO2_01_FULL_45_11]OGV94703.1 MAG: hypothetical protein A3A66_01685 [Microgenomates group bacterium RIFCSPLOWO2_01_FULL_46_13]
MRKIRQYYWFVASFVRHHLRGLILGIIGGIIVTLNFSSLIRLVPLKPTEYIGRPGSFTLPQLPLEIQQLVSDGLTQVDEAGQAQSALASRWETAEEGKVFTFTIGNGEKWADGKAVESTDLEYALDDITIDRPAPQIISFRLNDAYSPFPTVVSQPLFRRITTRNLLTKRTKIIGTKDFVIDEVRLRGGVIATLALRSSEQSRVFRFYPTEEDAIVAFKAGKVDRLEDISDPRDLVGWKNVTIEGTTNYDQYVALFYNTSHPDLASKSIRQALTYAIPDKDVSGERAISPISFKSWAYNPQVKDYESDPEAAKNLLDKEFSDKDSHLPPLEITTTQSYAPLAEKIVDAWKGLGITVTFKIVNFPDTSDYQILLIGQKVPSDPDQYTFWHSTQPTNFTHYNSPRIDKLLEDGRKTLDQDERKLIYQDFQRFLVEDAPAAFLYYLKSYTITRS